MSDGKHLFTVRLGEDNRLDWMERSRARGITLSAAIREGTRLYLDESAKPKCPSCEGAAGPQAVARLDEDSFGHWLAGFIDGEGSFKITSVKRSVTYRVQFGISLRADDFPLLKVIRERTGFGSLYRHPNIRQTNANPSASWSVHNKTDCLSLVEILDRYPLRSKKAQDYVLWRKAAMLWCRYRGNRWTAETPWHEMGILKAELEVGRQYRDPDQG